MKNSDKKAIGKIYNQNWPYLESWFETLAYIRNICAHYGRLYNIRLDKTPKIPEKDKQNSNSTIRVFWAVYCVGKLLPQDQDWLNFISELEALFKKYSRVDKDKMGFPENWLNLLGAVGFEPTTNRL